MTHAAQPQQDKDPGLAGVLLLPILILVMVFARFAGHLDRLKRFRRSRPSPKNWRSHFGRLRQCEWHICQILANGARQVLAFGDVDLHAIPMFVDAPEDFCWPEPSSPAALHIRMQGLARFHADPERYIRRHAERIAHEERRAREAERKAPLSSHANQPRRIALRPMHPALPSWTRGIPAPP